MFVFLGKYKDKFTIYSLSCLIAKLSGITESALPESFYGLMTSGFDDNEDHVTIFTKTINYIGAKLHTEPIKIVHVTDRDLWSADNLMATVIVQVLKKYRATDRQGAPYVRLFDVPDDLLPTTLEEFENQLDGDADTKFFKRWDYVIDEMIYAFEYITKNNDSHIEDENDIYYSNAQNRERCNNGLMLFARYFQNIAT